MANVLKFTNSYPYVATGDAESVDYTVGNLISMVGTLSELKTKGKGSLVGAVNEIWDDVPRGATATVESGAGIPAVSVTVTGEAGERKLSFAFSNLKGDTGAQGEKGEKGETGATGAKGEKGDDGFGFTDLSAAFAAGSESDPVAFLRTQPAGSYYIKTADEAYWGKRHDEGLLLTNISDEGYLYLDYYHGTDKQFSFDTSCYSGTLTLTPEKLLPGATQSDKGKYLRVGADGKAAWQDGDGPQDNEIGARTWSSQKILETLCPKQSVSGVPAQLTQQLAGYPLKLQAGWTPTQAAVPSPDNICAITGRTGVQITRTEDGKTITLTFPQTIYGGAVSAITGKAQSTWALVSFDGTEDWAIPSGKVTGYTPFRYTGLASSAKNQFICTHFPYRSGAYEGATGECLAGYGTTGQMIFVAANSRIAQDDVSAWKAYLAAQAAAGTPVTVAYRLVTPTVLQASGSEALSALKGANTFTSNATELLAVGRQDPTLKFANLADRLAALESAATGV